MKLKLPKNLSLILIFVLALGLRLYRLNAPVADWHSWRQADTIAVTRYYVQNKIDLLRPRYNDLSSNPSTLPNPEGYRMVEFPFINALTAWLYLHLPFASCLSLVVFSRLVSIAFSLGSLAYLYLLVKQLSGRKTALWAAFFFAVLPYNFFYSRTILPEVPLVFLSLAATFYLFQKKLWPSAVFLALALLLKPYILILLLPFVYWYFHQEGFSFLRQKSIYLALIIALLPFYLWRQWIQQFPEGIPQYLWLFNSGEIRFKGAFFNWLFAERLGKLILGYWGLILFGAGLVAKPNKKEAWFYYFWALALLVYLSVLAAGNVHHDYYQIITIPLICIFLAKGAVFLLQQAKKNLLSYLVLFLAIIFMLAFSWFNVRGYFNINHPEIVSAGQAADRLLPAEAKVIAPYQKDTAFLYQTNRSGWPSGGDIPEKIKAGAGYYISVNFDQETLDLAAKCPVISRTDQYIIIQLENCSL
jgi:hypothetical protein